MNKIVSLSAMAFLLSAPALAQENDTQSGQQVALPAACEEAASQGGQMDMSRMDSAMQQMMASMVATMKMHDPIMRAMTIKDPDLAFNCGMIAHHHGAIAMAEVELRMGKDEESRKLAQTIIDAQKKEIEEMTAWIEERARQ